MFPVCNSLVVRHQTKDKANLFLKAELLGLFLAGAGAVKVAKSFEVHRKTQDTLVIILCNIEVMADSHPPGVKKVRNPCPGCCPTAPAPENCSWGAPI